MPKVVMVIVILSEADLDDDLPDDCVLQPLDLPQLVQGKGSFPPQQNLPILLVMMMMVVVMVVVVVVMVVMVVMILMVVMVVKVVKVCPKPTS